MSKENVFNFKAGFVRVRQVVQLGCLLPPGVRIP